LGVVLVGLNAFAELCTRRTEIAVGWEGGRAEVVRGALGECVKDDDWLHWVGDFEVAVRIVLEVCGAAEGRNFVSRRALALYRRRAGATVAR
jgi:hypothetical protein